MTTAPSTATQPEKKNGTAPTTATQPEKKNGTAPTTATQPEKKNGTAPMMAAGEGSVGKAVFTTGVVERQPVDEVNSVYTDTKKLFFFTDIRNMQGKTVLHRWLHEGQTLAEVSFEVGGPSWRIYSSKNLSDEWLGNWKAEVVDSAGNRLHEAEFVYLKQE